MPENTEVAQRWARHMMRNPYESSDCIRNSVQQQQMELEIQVFHTELRLREHLHATLEKVFGPVYATRCFSTPRWKVNMRTWKTGLASDPDLRFIDCLHPRQYVHVLQGQVRGKGVTAEFVNAFTRRFGEKHPRIVELVEEIYGPANITHHRYIRPQDRTLYRQRVQELRQLLDF